MCGILQQEISAAADAAVRKYKEDIALEEVTIVTADGIAPAKQTVTAEGAAPAKRTVTAEGVAAAMRTSIKDSTDKYYKKLSKIVSVANPSLGSDWLLEV